MFWPQIAIFSGPKIFKSGSAVRPRRDLSNEVSHDHSSMYMVRLTKHRAKGAKSCQKGAKKRPKGANFVLFSLTTMRNGLKCKKKRKKNFFEKILDRKNRDFWPKLEVFGQKWPFSDPKDQFFGRPKKKFRSYNFLAAS